MLLLSLFLGLLPGFAWLVFYLSEDPHPEPKRLIVLTFFVGIAFGFFTIVIEQGFNGVMAHLGVAELSVASLLGLALIEEFMKFAAAYFAVGKSPVFIEQGFNGVMAHLGVAELSVASLLGLALIEEFMKFAAAYFAVGKSPVLID